MNTRVRQETESPDPRMASMSSKPAMRTDEQWVADLRSDPPVTAAVAELRDYLKRGLARSLAAGGDVGEADLDDFAQDAVLRVLDRLDSFRGDSRFATWALAVAIRVAYTALRRRRWGDCSLEDLGLSPVATPRAPSAPPDPAATSARQDFLAALRAAIDGVLTPKQRRAILAELAGMPTAVLGEQLGMSSNALYKLHHDARKKLRQALERAGFSEADVRECVQGASE